MNTTTGERPVERIVRRLEADVDLLRDVYMTRAQRQAYERILKDAERYRWLRDGDWNDLEDAYWSTSDRPTEDECKAAFDSYVDARLLTPNTALTGRAQKETK